ncbi:hypothetical protein DL771_002071 [Monosporascus sp. 5C6A]|nr:hypothetical protein DL771_002071 [Monosporascus sp. 5C6A]
MAESSGGGIWTNRYVANAAPWEHARNGNTEALYQTAFTAAKSLRVAGILLQPFMPDKAGEMLDQLDIDAGRRALADAAYKVSFVELRRGACITVFLPF